MKNLSLLVLPIIFFCGSFNASLNSQSNKRNQYFYDHLVETIIQNATLGFSDEVILLSESLPWSKINKMMNEVKNLKNIKVDTSLMFKIGSQINYQKNVIVLDKKIIQALDLSKLNYLRIDITTAIHMSKDSLSGYLIYFSTEFKDKNKFEWDSEGIVIGWLDNFGFFERFEHIENTFPTLHNIKLIDINK